jgi:biopolymer transport protein ExbD
VKINLDNNSEAPRVEVVPLIDIIFCILTFFLLSGLQMSSQQVMNIDIPPTGKTPEIQTGESMQVGIGQNGDLYVESNPSPISEAALVQSAKSYRAFSPNGRIVVSAHRQVSYERVTRVLDFLRDATKSNNVALNTKLQDAASPVQPALPSNPPPLAPLPSSSTNR